MALRETEASVRRLNERLNTVTGGDGIGVQNTPTGIVVSKLTDDPILAMVHAQIGATAEYEMKEIIEDGNVVQYRYQAGSQYFVDDRAHFNAWEADGRTNVANGERVLCFPVANGRFAFFRPVKPYLIDGSCMVDLAVPAGVAAGGTTCTVQNTVGGPGAIQPDAGTMQYVLLHFDRPALLGGAEDTIVHIAQPRIIWTMAAQAWGDLHYHFWIDWITQDFDWNNDGSVAPPRNTWATKPTFVVGTQQTIGLEITNSLAVQFSPFTSNTPMLFFLQPGAPVTAYGLQIRPLEWSETTATIFATTWAQFFAPGTVTYVLPML